MRMVVVSSGVVSPGVFRDPTCLSVDRSPNLRCFPYFWFGTFFCLEYILEVLKWNLFFFVVIVKQNVQVMESLPYWIHELESFSGGGHDLESRRFYNAWKLGLLDHPMLQRAGELTRPTHSLDRVLPAYTGRLYSMLQSIPEFEPVYPNGSTFILTEETAHDMVWGNYSEYISNVFTATTECILLFGVFSIVSFEYRVHLCNFFWQYMLDVLGSELNVTDWHTTSIPNILTQIELRPEIEAGVRVFAKLLGVCQFDSLLPLLDGDELDVDEDTKRIYRAFWVTLSHWSVEFSEAQLDEVLFGQNASNVTYSVGTTMQTVTRAHELSLQEARNPVQIETLQGGTNIFDKKERRIAMRKRQAEKERTSQTKPIDAWAELQTLLGHIKRQFFRAEPRACATSPNSAKTLQRVREAGMQRVGAAGRAARQMMRVKRRPCFTKTTVKKVLSTFMTTAAIVGGAGGAWYMMGKGGGDGGGGKYVPGGDVTNAIKIQTELGEKMVDDLRADASQAVQKSIDADQEFVTGTTVSTVPINNLNDPREFTDSVRAIIEAKTFCEMAKPKFVDTENIVSTLGEQTPTPVGPIAIAGMKCDANFNKMYKQVTDLHAKIQKGANAQKNQGHANISIEDAVKESGIECSVLHKSLVPIFQFDTVHILPFGDQACAIRATDSSDSSYIIYDRDTMDAIETKRQALVEANPDGISKENLTSAVCELLKNRTVRPIVCYNDDTTN